jgi:hypothetical protein
MPGGHFGLRVPMIWPLTTLTSEVLTGAMLVLGFAVFSLGVKVGQIVEAAWWKGKLQALTSTREPPKPTTPFRDRTDPLGDRRERADSRPGSLLRRPRLSGGKPGLQRAHDEAAVFRLLHPGPEARRGRA